MQCEDFARLPFPVMQCESLRLQCAGALLAARAAPDRDPRRRRFAMARAYARAGTWIKLGNRRVVLYVVPAVVPGRVIFRAAHVRVDRLFLARGRGVCPLGIRISWTAPGVRTLALTRTHADAGASCSSSSPPSSSSVPSPRIAVTIDARKSASDSGRRRSTRTSNCSAFNISAAGGSTPADWK